MKNFHIKIKQHGRLRGGLIAMLVGLLLLLTMATVATSLPWDSAFDTIRKSLTGPVAVTIALAGLVGAGAMLIFGRSEMSEIISRVLYLVIVIALIFLGAAIIEALYPAAVTSATGALLPW